MNMSDLVTRIKLTCGLYVLNLPFVNVDEVISEVIKRISRRTFSSFMPFYQTFRYDLKTLERIDKEANYETYLFPEFFSEREIMFVRDVRYDEADVAAVGYWGGGIPLIRGNMLRQGMLTNAGLALTNKMVPKMTFKFEYPRQITLYNIFSSANVVFELGLMHDENLASIKPTQEESFFELASLDVKDVLYQTAKHYNEISTPYGNISLKLDDWGQAADQRKQLIEEWKNSYHMDIIPFKYG